MSKTYPNKKKSFPLESEKAKLQKTKKSYICQKMSWKYVVTGTLVCREFNRNYKHTKKFLNDIRFSSYLVA